MTSRGAAAVALLVLTGALIAVLALTTPWHVLNRPAGGRTAVFATRDFSPTEIQREEAFHRAFRPSAYAGLLIGLTVTVLLGFTPLGARLIGAVARPAGGGWGWRVVLGGLTLAALGQLFALPFAAYGETVLRRYGLSTQDWGGWTVDLLKSFGIRVGVSMAVLLGFVSIVRAAPRTWWVWTAMGSAVLVVALSFLYPVVVEPLFNKFTPMPAGALRTSLFELARHDHVPVRDVLIADASRRTTALNAYVSGFGSTRRLVVYDTLVRSAPPQEVRLVVAHELGHAKRGDVLHGTLVGALGAAAACCLAYLLLTWPWLLRRAGVPAAGDGRAVALLLALAALAGVLTLPIQSLVSRRIEARADVHALELTHDPATFIANEKRLSVSNLSDLQPNPIVYGLFFDHPSGPERIALARDWERLHRS
ncbi:MAG: M48 family metallopeptidase [Actinomycetota bacterium]|nr:M48 family metallopeptidase [Actinomycetota bacterium]